MVIVPLPGPTRRRAPSGTGAAIGRGAEEVAAAVHDQAGSGHSPLVPLNEASVVMVPLPGNLEDRAGTDAPP